MKPILPQKTFCIKKKLFSLPRLIKEKQGTSLIHFLFTKNFDKRTSVLKSLKFQTLNSQTERTLKIYIISGLVFAD